MRYRSLRLNIININIVSDSRINLKNDNNNDNNSNNKCITEISLFSIFGLYYKSPNKNEILEVGTKTILIFGGGFYKYYKTELLNKN